MPALSTRGGALSRIHRYPDRIQGSAISGVCYFNHGATGTAYRTNTREKFVMATAAVTSVANLISTCANQSAASNSTVGIIATGFNGANSPAKEKFIFSTETSILTTSSTLYNTYSAGVGNADEAVFHLGWGSTYSATRNSHSYATDMVALTTAATVPSYAGSAVGLLDYAIFSLGGVSAGTSTTTNKYTYASKTNVTYTSLLTATSGGCATGNSTLGLFSIGNTRTTNLLTYATGTYVLSSLMPVNVVYGAAAGNSSNAIIAVGGKDVSFATNKKYNYNYTTKSVVATTASLQAMWGGSAMSTTVKGVNSL